MANSHNTYRAIRHLSMFCLIAGGLLITQPAQPAVVPGSAQQSDSGAQKARIPNQMETVTGTVLIQEESGKQTYYLDIDGDGTGDYQLKFQSADLINDLPAAGSQVTVKGEIHGQTLDVHQVKKQ